MTGAAASAATLKYTVILGMTGSGRFLPIKSSASVRSTVSGNGNFFPEGDL